MFGVEQWEIDEARKELEQQKEAERKKDQESANIVAADILGQCDLELDVH
jgi:hypothetical protein